jgi:hypothetical protein
MSEHDTLPPDSERTDVHHVIPLSPPEFDIETSDAPTWAKALYRQANDRRAEDRAQLDRIERNQRIQRAEVQRISGRVVAHDAELEEIRDRVSDLEDWRDERDGRAAE